jgi:uncharacterized protein YndB with AHSA1/START domain
MDRIEREIMIHAPIARVWELVTEPGWWIGDGDRSGQQVRLEGNVAVVNDPRFGRFPVRVEDVRPQRYASFRWASGYPGDEPREGNSTLIEFWLSERDGGTQLRLVESGFASLEAPDDGKTRAVAGNIEGWRQQLDVLKGSAERVRT